VKIGVLIKQVPDTATNIKVNADGTGIDPTGIKFVVNPYDEMSIEEGLKTKEKAGGEVVIVSLGPVRCVEAIRTGLAMGADKGIHISDEGVTVDSYLTARVLAKVLEEEKFDVIFCGKQAVDNDSAQVGPMVAEFLNIPQVTVVEKLEVNEANDGATATRRVGGGAREVFAISFPAIIAVEKGINTPRYASLPGIMKAKSKPLTTLKVADLAGGEQAKVQFSNYRLPPERPAGKVLEGEAEQTVPQLVKLLREEAKVI
jgi:electron transfer flavoprotein beta subunit